MKNLKTKLAIILLQIMPSSLNAIVSIYITYFDSLPPDPTTSSGNGITFLAMLLLLPFIGIVLFIDMVVLVKSSKFLLKLSGLQKKTVIYYIVTGLIIPFILFIPGFILGNVLNVTNYIFTASFLIMGLVVAVVHVVFIIVLRKSDLKTTSFRTLFIQTVEYLVLAAFIIYIVINVQYILSSFLYLVLS